MYGHEGMGFAGWWGLGLGMLLFWGLVIAGLVLLVRWAVGSRGDQRPLEPPAAPGPPVVPPAAEAHRILDERFARGEIDDEEYRRRRDLLRGG